MHIHFHCSTLLLAYDLFTSCEHAIIIIEAGCKACCQTVKRLAGLQWFL